MGVELSPVWKDFATVEMNEPYIPGFLAFREVQHLEPLFERLRRERPELFPDITIFDGNGVLHPNGFGIACHFGVLSNICTMGMGKNLHIVDDLDRDGVKKRCAESPGSVVCLVGASGRTW